ncbi:MAG: flagellar biosynthetic protein FliO [Bryobacteraceae bacterium]
MIHWLRTNIVRIGWKRPGPGPRLQSIERLTLTPHHSLHLVRVDDRTVMVAVSPSSCTVTEMTPSREELE